MKNEAWQGKGTGRSVGGDKGCNLASHDSAPPSEDENSTEEKPGDRVREELIELEDLEMQGSCCNSWENGRVRLKEIKVQSDKNVQNTEYALKITLTFGKSHCTARDEAF